MWQLVFSATLRGVSPHCVRITPFLSSNFLRSPLALDADQQSASVRAAASVARQLSEFHPFCIASADSVQSFSKISHICCYGPSTLIIAHEEFVSDLAENFRVIIRIAR